jgi:hypothetical protein
MPSAIPLPRGPSHLVLFGAEDLLRGAGCPVCRYESEADDRFYGWFALEGHADVGLITRLCRSLGMCPVHTRGLLRQPGAETRMTAVYRYPLRAAADCLTAGTSPRAPCPGCARRAEATLRAVDTLLTGLRDEDLREAYRDAGGLCLPHLRAALSRSGRRLGSWLAGDMAGRLARVTPDLARLAGDVGADADLRASLRAALPAGPGQAAPALSAASASAGSGEGEVCQVCLEAALAERGALVRTDGTGLCPAHLHDACLSRAVACTGARSPAAPLLARQAEQASAWLAGPTAPAVPRRAVRRVIGCGRGLTGGSRGPGYPDGPDGPAGCPVCATASAAAVQALTCLPEAQLPGLCLRDVLSLGPQDPRRRAVAATAARRTGSVLRELEEALGKRTWARRHEPRGDEMTAWRRAAALIDGRVYGGGPPGSL